MLEVRRNEHELIEDWEKRLIEELIELAEKTEKLNYFMATKQFLDMKEDHQNLLRIQYDIMNSYMHILIIRVNKFAEVNCCASKNNKGFFYKE